jgi:hypothetical protein
MVVGITEHGWTTSAWLPYRVSAACLEPRRAIKYLSHIGVSFITAVEGHYRKPAGQHPSLRAPAVLAVTTVIAAATTRRPTAAHGFVRVHGMVLSFQTEGSPSAMGCNCRINNPFRSEHSFRYIPG